MTYNAPRAYEIAKRFKFEGIPVIIGGIHASMVPNEVINYCSAVMIGEAENVWHKVIADLENNSIKGFYYGSRISLENLRMPRRDLFKRKYRLQPVQTSRGCPMNCGFCSVTKFNGVSFRRRKITQIIKEIESIKEKRIFFVDDNIIGVNKKCENDAINLFNSLKDYGLKWSSQASLNIVKNEKLLKSISESGGIGFLIGIESISKNSLEQMEKYTNLKIGIKNYKKAIRKLHDYGIGVNGSIMVGNDGDTKDIFERTSDFINDVELDRAQITIATPLPGTRFYERLAGEGRILNTDYPKDWRYYDCAHVVFKPKNMTVPELYGGFLDIYKDTTSFLTSSRRFFRSLMNTSNILNSASSFFYNFLIHKAILVNSRNILGYERFSLSN
jgi:radical SAM superfamily enzyme YgiQ (UPF0313 family)